jgi:glucose/arabinose dehydrogenase
MTFSVPPSPKMPRAQGGGYSRCAVNLAAFVWLAVALGPQLVRAVEVPSGFVAETIATNLNAATAIAPTPDGRVFIADQTGRLLVWKDGRVLDAPALALHVTDYWERGLIGLALDSDFPRPPHLYLLYVTDKPFVHHVLARFTIQGDVIDPSSETILLEGDDQATLGGSVAAGHQGGALRFGSDGGLYVSIGEQTAGEPAQRLDTLQGKILRLNRDGSIPTDNPFFSETSGKYRSIYARGVRNSFGIAAQPKADGGRMFFTDVGGSAFEEVNELKPGANYGWPHAEGISTNAAFANPLHAYPPMIGQSVVGGAFVPRSTFKGQSPNWPEKWRGRFFFADFMKHWIKALDPDAPTNVLTFARGLNGPVATELAPDGSLFVLNRGAIWRDPKKFVPNAGSLVRIRYLGEGKPDVGAPNSDSARSLTNFAALGLPLSATLLPRKLARAEWELRSQGVRRWPIWINSRPWHHLVRENVAGLYLPDGTPVNLTDPNADVILPPGAVVVRNFSVSTAWTNRPPMENPERRIETRLLVIGKPYSYGASYRWRGDEAELVEDSEVVTLSDLAGERGNGQLPKTASVNWWFPALDDAISFPIINPAYWISTAPPDFVTVPPQLRSVPPVNWLAAMLGANVLVTKFASGLVSNIPPGTVWESPLMPLEARVRSYLHGNCAVCHQPGGVSRGNLDLRLTTPLARTGLINGEPVAGDLGIAGAKILAPGSPEKSLLYQRVKRTDFFRMPPIAYHNEPSPVLPLLDEWIRSLDQTTKVNRPAR